MKYYLKQIFSTASFLYSFSFFASAQNTWVQKTSMPASPRAGAVAFALNGFGYAGTGLDSLGHLLNDFWKYDAANDSWSQAADFPGTPRKNAVAFVTDSFAFVGTGIDSIGLTKDFYRFDGGANSWVRIEDLDSANAVYPRRDAAAFAIGKRGYVVGGYDGTTFYSKENWEYDVTRDTVWKRKTAFPQSGRRWATSFTIDGYGFVGMGFNYSQEYFNDFWKYDTVTAAWTQVADFPGNIRSDAPAFVINGYAFAGAGFDGALKNDFYRYDYVANSWATIASYGGLPTSSASAFSLNGKGYVVCGLDTLGYKSELWEYTPDNLVSIHEPSASLTGISPIPATSSITVTNKTNRDINVRLFNSKGSLVMNQKLSVERSELNVEHFPRGIYYFSISIQGKTIDTGKLMLE